MAQVDHVLLPVCVPSKLAHHLLYIYHITRPIVMSLVAGDPPAPNKRGERKVGGDIDTYREREGERKHICVCYFLLEKKKRKRNNLEKE